MTRRRMAIIDEGIRIMPIKTAMRETGLTAATCGAIFLLAATASAGEWTYDSDKRQITHSDSGWEEVDPDGNPLDKTTSG